MYKFYKYFVITLLLLVGGNSLATNAYDFSFTSIDGESQIDLSEFKGKTLWINHTEGDTMILGWERIPTTPQYIDITSWGTDNSSIKDFI